MCILPCYDNTHFDVLHLWFVWKFDIVVCIFFRNYRRTIINFYSFSSRVIKWACFDFKNDFFTNPLDQIRKSIKKKLSKSFYKIYSQRKGFYKITIKFGNFTKPLKYLLILQIDCNIYTGSYRLWKPSYFLLYSLLLNCSLFEINW